MGPDRGLPQGETGLKFEVAEDGISGAVRKRSVTIRGHRTSFSLEPEFAAELETIAARRGLSVAARVAEVDAARPAGSNLSSALRVFVLATVKQDTG